MLTRKHVLDLLVPILRAGRYHSFANDYYDRQESNQVVKISYDLAAYFDKQNCMDQVIDDVNVFVNYHDANPLK